MKNSINNKPLEYSVIGCLYGMAILCLTGCFGDDKKKHDESQGGTTNSFLTVVAHTVHHPGLADQSEQTVTSVYDGYGFLRNEKESYGSQKETIYDYSLDGRMLAKRQKNNAGMDILTLYTYSYFTNQMTQFVDDFADGIVDATMIYEFSPAGHYLTDVSKLSSTYIVHYTYDSNGDFNTVNNNGLNYILTYDTASGRVVSIIGSGGSLISYIYNIQERLIQITIDTNHDLVADDVTDFSYQGNMNIFGKLVVDLARSPNTFTTRAFFQKTIIVDPFGTLLTGWTDTPVYGSGGVTGYTKLSAYGNILSDSATQWSCVMDNGTGLIWENKTSDGGLHDKSNTYTWYNTNSKTNGGNTGYANGGSCTGGSQCDTQSFIFKVNSAGLCGAGDWRLPRLAELQTLVDGNFSPMIDQHYFPDQKYLYWSSEPYAYDKTYAWSLSFNDGNINYDGKFKPYFVRLVRHAF